MTSQLPLLTVPEFRVYDPIDPSVLEVIESQLMMLSAAGQPPSIAAAFDADQKLIGADKIAPVDALQAVSQRILEAQQDRGSLIGKTTLHAALVEFSSQRLYPWHSDSFNDAYVVATQASTEGLSGAIAAESPLAIEEAIKAAEQEDEDLKQIPSLAIVRPAVGSLIHLPLGIVHRSPAAADGQDGWRMLVNGVVIPNFLSTMFG